MNIVDQAHSFALERHGDQKYGNNLPYEWHLQKVASLAQRLGYTEEIQAAAWLHDVVEDTNTSLNEIRSMFGSKIADIVYSVTYSAQDKAAGTDKIDKARQNKGGHVVKFCDSTVNFSASALDGSPSGMSQWNATVDRYGLFLADLLPGLPTPKDIEAWLESE